MTAYASGATCGIAICVSNTERACYGSGIIATAQPKPATLNVLVAAINVIVGWSFDAIRPNGMCGLSLRIRSAQISSLTMSVSCLDAVAMSASTNCFG